jgi:hypothetical protein
MLSAVNAVHAVVAAVPGIVAAYTTVPMSVTTAALPMALVTPISENRRQHAHELVRIETLVRVRIVHSPVAQGITESQQLALYALADAVMTALTDDITLGGQVDHVASVDADEPAIYTLAGTDYLSISIAVRVVEKI